MVGADQDERIRVLFQLIHLQDSVLIGITSLDVHHWNASPSPRMNPFVITIPSWVAEHQFPRLLSLLRTGENHPAVEIDISSIKFLTPAAIVAILVRCNRWKREGKAISLSGADTCENLGYLQRMDFLSHLGVNIPENFIRRNPSGRFVPVQTLNFASGNVDQIASEISRCTLPDASPVDDVYRLLQYAAGELLSNAKYHSGGRAFVCAQFFPKMNLVRIAVADAGIGIRQSFLNTSREAEAATPDAAIRLALQPRVSSVLLRPNPNPYAGQNHRGVGLSITRVLAHEAVGRLSIVSEDGWFDELHGTEQDRPKESIFFPGTLVALSLHRDHISDYAAMHEEAMTQMGMEILDSDGIFVD